MSNSPSSTSRQEHQEKQAEIDEAARRLAQALEGSDYTTVEQTLSKVRQLAYPSPSKQEKFCQSRVLDARAAQRAVALFRTEARLYADQAEKTRLVLQKLERSAMWLENQDFYKTVMEPVQQEYHDYQQKAARAQDMALQKEDEFVKLRREAHSAVSKLCLKEERQYRHEFAAALSYPGGADAAEQVYQVLADFEERSKQEAHPKQPVPSDFEATTPEYMAWLRNQAQEAIDDTDSSGSFSSLVAKLAEECNGVATIAPLKGYERTVQKVQDKYGGDYSKVLDLVRGMICFETIPDLASALQLLESLDANGKVRVVRAKDRLSTHFDASQFAGGYRDVLLNLRLMGSDNDSPQLIAELQLHLNAFIKIKNDRGHVNYEAARNIHMFNPAFTTRSFLWEPDTDEAEIEEFLTDVRTGVIANLKLDYSTGLWSHENKVRLAEAFEDLRCNVKQVSLRSCRCGNEFILMSINDEFLDKIPKDLPPIVSTVRLGSLVHEGTAGRVSQVGIERLLLYLNPTLRVLDLEGCLDLDWYENCGDDVAKAFVKHVDETIAKGEQPLPQFHELNLKSTGLTERGAKLLESLKKDRKLPRLTVLRDEDLTKPPNRVGPHRRPAVKKDESAFLHSSQVSELD